MSHSPNKNYQQLYGHGETMAPPSSLTVLIPLLQEIFHKATYT